MLVPRGRAATGSARVFTPDEIAEACAALAPARDPISIQRWSPQRLTLTAGAAFGVRLLAGLFLDSLRAGLT